MLLVYPNASKVRLTESTEHNCYYYSMNINANTKCDTVFLNDICFISFAEKFNRTKVKKISTNNIVN